MSRQAVVVVWVLAAVVVGALCSYGVRKVTEETKGDIAWKNHSSYIEALKEGRTPPPPLEDAVSEEGSMTTDLWTLVAAVSISAMVVVGGLCGYVADVKGRSSRSWFFLGILCGIFALIAIAGTPALTVAPYKPIKGLLKSQRDDPENWTGRGGTQ